MDFNFVSFSKNVNATPAGPFFKVGENKLIYFFDLA